MRQRLHHSIFYALAVPPILCEWAADRAAIVHAADLLRQAARDLGRRHPASATVVDGARLYGDWLLRYPSTEPRREVASEGMRAWNDGVVPQLLRLWQQLEPTIRPALPSA